MLARERQTEILMRLLDAGSARVTELAQSFRVAEETIRRDLDKLAREGKLLRTHGGAVPAEDTALDLPFSVRRTANLEAKRAIARQALTHVQEGDVIAFDASTTVHQLALAIPEMPLTVVTNSLPASAALLRRRSVRVLSTGGMLDAPSWSWTGSVAEQALERINIQKLFLSTKGVDLVRGLSEADDGQARLKRRMMDVAEKIYLLVDHSKFGGKSVVSLAEMNEVDVVIADAATDPSVVEGLRKLGVDVEIAGQAASD